MHIAVSGDDFGWGSAGKLTAILQALRARPGGTRVTGLGTDLGRRIMPDGLVDEWEEVSAARKVVDSLDAAIVLLDPSVADTLSALRCPVVYVDSLPYLWTEHDRLPLDVAAYCAQRFLPVSDKAARVLAHVPNLRWVEPIVSPLLSARRARDVDQGLALVSVGGIHSPLSAESAAAHYLSLTLPPVAKALIARGTQRIAIAGNVRLEDLPDLDDALAVTLLEPSQTAFLDALRAARWVLASPGLTSILEIAAIGRSAVLLPPQNLSQFHHAEHVSAVLGSGMTVPWPERMLSPGDIREWHRLGEAVAVTRIYSAIAAAAGRRDSYREDLMRAAARAVEAHEGRPNAFGDLAQSFRGAEQVASCVAEVANSARGHQGR